MIFFKKHSRFFALLIFLFAFLPDKKVAAQNTDETQQYFEISKNLEIFNHLFQELNNLYVNPIYPGKMTKIGINAMLATLDPYTNFFTESDVENYRIQSNGKYDGVGIITKKIDGNLVVGRVIQHAPADKAGLHPGDILLSVNGNSLRGKSTDELAMLMQGDKGTKLTLQIQNPITKKEKTLSISRSKVNISDVPYAGLLGKDSNVAYVRLTQFMGPASGNIHKALDSLKKIQPNLKGVIIDLRGNPGGLLKEAVKTCNLFIPKGQIVVTTRGKSPNWNRTYKTPGQPWDTKIPLVILVNHQSASASEIVAGTMQDLDRGVIIGTRSFGKGLVQQVRPLGYGVSLKVTVAHYYTPSGRCIQALDYAHRNPDGSVSKIPDSLMQSFKTRNGRIVKDGGGIKPDIFIPEEEPDQYVQTLSNKGFLFKYATKYYYSHPKITAASKFRLGQKDFSDFTNWLQQQNFIAATKEGMLLKKLKTQAEKEKQFATIKQPFETLFNQLKQVNQKALTKDQTTILNLLSSEIAGRYYYQKGATLNQLSQHDATLKKALEVLNHPEKYQNMLK